MDEGCFGAEETEIGKEFDGAEVVFGLGFGEFGALFAGVNVEGEVVGGVVIGE